MKIVQFTSAHSQFDTRIFYKISQSLGKFGHEVVHIGPKKEPGIEGLQHGVLFKPIKSLKNRFERLTLGQWHLYKAIKAENADIYHFHDPDLIILGLILKAQGRKVIYDVHEDYPEQMKLKAWIPFFLKPLICKFTHFFEMWGAKKFDAIATATETIAQKFPSQKTIVLKNYPLLEEMGVDKNPIAYHTRKNDACYIGSISKERGLYTMLEAIAGLGNIKLTIAGAAKKIDAEAIRASDNVFYEGVVNREKIYDILIHHRCGLVVLHPTSTYYTSLPVKLFEYMSCGTPVIASNFPLFKEIVEGNRAGLCVDPQNPKAVAEAIKFIFDNPDEAAKMSENGRKAVLEHYNWETEAQKLKTLYEKLAG